jgi:hypothetical protein
MKENFDSTIYYFLGIIILASAIIIFISRKAALYSYGTMSAALFVMMFVIYTFLRNQPISKITFRVILGIIEHGLPIIILFLITSWLFFINIKYYDKIQRDTISPDYRKYEYFSLGFLIAEILVLLQLIGTLVKIAKKEAAKETENIAEDKATATKMRAGIYLLSTFNMIFVGIMHSIIALFVTDG